MRRSMRVPAYVLLFSASSMAVSVIVVEMLHHILLIASLVACVTLAAMAIACISLDFTRLHRRRPIAAHRVLTPAASPDDRAWTKLMESLDSTQRHTLQNNGWFDVVSSTGHHWRISATGYMGNCFRYSGFGLYAKQYCAHLYPSSLYPLADHLLAQALWITTDEVAFREIARTV
jgi:hypothetical protein